jgi:hypothetical protein
MPVYNGTRVLINQTAEKTLECGKLGMSELLFPHQAYTQRIEVLPAHVGTGPIVRSAPLYFARLKNNIVIPDTIPTLSLMPSVNGPGVVTPAVGGIRAVQYDLGDSHLFIILVFSIVRYPPRPNNPNSNGINPAMSRVGIVNHMPMIGNTM